jgi:lipopolysaccharide biosynthesis glycosyltransferase
MDQYKTCGVTETGMGHGARRPESPLLIVMACDASYAVALATSIRSIADSNPFPARSEIVVLTSAGFAAELKDKVVGSVPESAASIRWVEVDLSQFAQFSTAPYISVMTYARLLIPYVLPRDSARALYLDTDILVLKELRSLWSCDMGGAVLAAARDVYSNVHAARLGSALAAEPRYFNAGVLLIDIARWREEGVSEKALEYLRENPETHLSDQDALNVVCRGRWHELDSKWNCQPARPEQTQSAPEACPAILHFVGPFKPWDARSRSIYACLYDSFRKRTRFARTRFEVARDTWTALWSRSKHNLRQYYIMRLIWRFAMRREPRGVIHASANPPAATVEKA